MLEPFWSSDIVYRESVVFIDDGKGGPPLAQLLFEPVRILSVERADRALRFDEGKDFSVDPAGRGLLRTAESRAPVIASDAMYPPKGTPNSLPAKADDPDRHMLFDNGHWFHDQQIEVTYLRKPDAWKGPSPQFDASQLPKTLAKLKQRQPVTIGVSGDSISAGYNASGYTNAPPRMPPYPDLVAAELRYLFGGSVKLINRAISGWSAAQGITDLDELLKNKPDLVLVAYGMNDVGGRDPETYGERIGTIVQRIQENSPDTEIVLIAPMLGNGDWRHTPLEMFPQYRDELKKRTGPGVALVDLTALWQSMMERKRHLDITGNGVNHPNDFGHRVYASAILTLLADPEAVRAAMPVPAAELTKRFKLPDGFHATLFANEPDVVQPIAFTFDDRGRMWVVECHSYPDWKSGKKDRVLILEDTDGDGVADSRKVFWEEGTNLTGIAYGFGGIWLCSTPNLIFVPDANRDDLPDGAAQVKLDGWDLEARHNAFNGLIWGPDGWLYGCNGILSNSRVGPPGTPDDKRTPLNCAVWRYHPTDARFEAVTHGTTNPWGLTFDDHGEMFLTNCVIKHLFHVIPGAHYVRMFGQDINPNSYGLIESCADHIHWAGGHWTEARGGVTHDSFGGGHAHSGAAVYLGDMFPPEYRNRIYMCNIHGNRLNQDILERQGSGYVAHHAEDFFHAGDPWFRGIAVHLGPDGALYVSDWSDTGECHNYVVADRSNGRIVRIAYGQPKSQPEDLSTKSDRELIELQQSSNDWLARTARRILQERTTQTKLSLADGQRLRQLVRDKSQDAPRRLRALWTLFAVGGFDDAAAMDGIADPQEDIRRWSVRLAVDRPPSQSIANRLASLAGEESDPSVQLALASALQKLDPESARQLAGPLVERVSTADDPNLPWMLWYGIEPLVAEDSAWGVSVAQRTPLVNLRQSIVRRMAGLAEMDPTHWQRVFELIAAAKEGQRTDCLFGLSLALEGRRHVAMPPGWSSLYATILSTGDREAAKVATRIALIFDDPEALARLTSTVGDGTALDTDREEALAALIQARPPALVDVLTQALDVPALRLLALRGLAAVDDERIGGWILDRFQTLDNRERDAAVSTLAARVSLARRLLDAVDQEQVPRSAITAYHIQQMQTLGDEAIVNRLAENWGAVRPSPEDRLAKIQEYKSRLTPQAVAMGDAARGRRVFKKNCASCHKLFDDGGAIGPELTGSQRSNLDYVLQNVIDPSAVVPRDYQMQLFVTEDGRTISGIVKREDQHTVVVQTTSELLSIPLEEIEHRRGTGLSMMPDGLWSTLSDSDWRDLVRYLSSDQQVPLPAQAAGP